MPCSKKTTEPAKPARASRVATPIAAVRHKGKGVNILGQELRDFVVDEKQPEGVLCLGGPSLDPRLEWKGNTE